MKYKGCFPEVCFRGQFWVSAGVHFNNPGVLHLLRLWGTIPIHSLYCTDHSPFIKPCGAHPRAAVHIRTAGSFPTFHPHLSTVCEDGWMDRQTVPHTGMQTHRIPPPTAFPCSHSETAAAPALCCDTQRVMPSFCTARPLF